MIYKHVRTLLISAAIIMIPVCALYCTGCITATQYSQADDSTLQAVIP